MASFHRLGGIPTGVVAVETRSVELSIPADPANLDSEAKVRTRSMHALKREQASEYLDNYRHPGIDADFLVCIFRPFKSNREEPVNYTIALIGHGNNSFLTHLSTTNKSTSSSNRHNNQPPPQPPIHTHTHTLIHKHLNTTALFLPESPVKESL